MEHRITVCTSCQSKTAPNSSSNKSPERPGHKLIDQLRDALDQAGEGLPERFEVSGVACMAGCKRPCTVAYYGAGKATYLFGDIDAAKPSDIDDLVTFARQYAYLGDGWCSSFDRPGKLKTSTLARVPAALVIASQSNENGLTP